VRVRVRARVRVRVRVRVRAHDKVVIFFGIPAKHPNPKPNP
jgi:hypothetical protein